MKRGKQFIARDGIAPGWMAELGHRNATVVGFEHAGRLVALLHFAHPKSARLAAAALSDLSARLRRARAVHEWRAWCYEQCGRALVNHGFRFRNEPMARLRDALLIERRETGAAKEAA